MNLTVEAKKQLIPILVSQKEHLRIFNNVQIIFYVPFEAKHALNLDSTADPEVMMLEVSMLVIHRNCPAPHLFFSTLISSRVAEKK